MTRQGFPPRCPTCEDAGSVLVGEPPYPADYEVAACPDCAKPTAWTVRIPAYGGGDLDGAPLDEATAKRTFRGLIAAGFRSVDLLYRVNAWDQWRSALLADREDALGVKATGGTDGCV